MEFRHLLISRLNVYYKTKMADRGFDIDAWLLERVEIFKKFCLPSILNQSNKNFYWFFYIDSETPLEVKSELATIFQPYPFVKLISHQYDSFNITKYLNSDIRKYLEENFQYLISSRVDTDDMLNKDYIEIVQKQFKNQEYQALNFNKGLVYHVPTGVSSIMIHKYNAFMSLIEKRSADGFKTVFFKQHTEYKTDPYKVETKIKQAMWCVSIHGLNDSTGFYGRVIKFNKLDFKENFGFQYQKLPSFMEVLNFTIRSYSRTLQKVMDKFLMYFNLKI